MSIGPFPKVSELTSAVIQKSDSNLRIWPDIFSYAKLEVLADGDAEGNYVCPFIEGSSQWQNSAKSISLQRMPLSQMDESEMQDIQILSTFRKEWEQEFLEISFSAFEITAFCVLFGTY